MLSVYNDEDIIKEVIENLISQEIPLVVLDNGSTDNSYKICEKFLGKGILDLKQLRTPTFLNHRSVIWRTLYDMALVQIPDWIIIIASDEFLESGISRLTLKDSINKVDLEGYNLIQFDRFDFYMTDADDESKKLVKERLRYYSCNGDYLYRAWKFFPGIRVGESGGHLPFYPVGHQYKIFPQKFILRHYPFRSKEQKKKKMIERTRGTDYLNIKKNKESKVSYHLKNIIEDKINHKLLTKYEQNKQWNYELKYCPWRTSSPRKKDDIFTKNGYLKDTPLTLEELQLKLKDAENNRKITRLIINKFKHFLKKQK